MFKRDFRKKKSGIGKFWDWLWNSKSIWSWAVLFVVAFFVIQFVFFPVLGAIFSSKLPAVIVESGSMEHNWKPFDEFWQPQEKLYYDLGITKEQFLKFSFKDGFDKGDIIIVRGMKNEGYKIGNVIIFSVSTQKTPIIHRIVKIEETSDGKIYSTKGDHNLGQLDVEKKILSSQIIGKAVFIIPKLGWAKLAFVELFRAIAR